MLSLRDNTKIAEGIVFWLKEEENIWPGKMKMKKWNDENFTDKEVGKEKHIGPEHASGEKILSMVNILIFVHKNVYRIIFQEIKIGS